MFNELHSLEIHHVQCITRERADQLGATGRRQRIVLFVPLWIGADFSRTRVVESINGAIKVQVLLLLCGPPSSYGIRFHGDGAMLPMYVPHEDLEGGKRGKAAVHPDNIYVTQRRQTVD